MFKKKQTTAEWYAQLSADPGFQALEAERNAAIAANRLMLDTDQRPIIEALAAVGVRVKSVWDLVNTNAGYAPAIPVLVSFLTKSHHHKTREGLARALTTPEAIGVAGPVLVQCMDKSTSPAEQEFRWCCANALRVVATKQDIPELERLLRDQRHERCHRDLKSALTKAKKRSA
jgi:hypothetical protein